MAKCLIAGCKNVAENNISIRCRRADTTAIWAPNTEAYLCDIHADEGYIIDISLTTAALRKITTNVSANGGSVYTRTTDIQNHP